MYKKLTHSSSSFSIFSTSLSSSTTLSNKLTTTTSSFYYYYLINKRNQFESNLKSINLNYKSNQNNNNNIINIKTIGFNSTTNKTDESTTAEINSKLDIDKIKWLIPIASLAILIFVFMFTFGFFCIWKLYNLKQNNKRLNSKKWTSLNEENIGSNYGTCDDKSSNYSNVESIDSSNLTNTSESKGNKCFKLPASLTWPSSLNLFKLLRDHNQTKTLSKEKIFLNNKDIELTEKSSRSKGGRHSSKRKYKTDEDISLRQLSRMSSINSSASYNSINSLTTILSNENLPQSSSRLEQSNMILNYSLYLNEKTKSLLINIVSLENIKLPVSLLSSNLELNVYIRIELIPPKDTMVASQFTNMPKLNAKTRFIKNRSNPVYEETFEFNNLTYLYDNLLDNLNEISSSSSNQQQSSLASASISSNSTSCSYFRLVFNICNSNMFGRDQLIGQCVHTLKKDDLVNSNVDSISKAVVDTNTISNDNNNNNVQSSICRIYSKKVDLVDSKSPDVNLGQLHMSLVYNNTTKSIRLHILKACNLQLPKYFLNSDKKPNAYIKIYMLYRGQRVDKKQTKIIEHSNDPIFDQTFEFNVLNLLQLCQPMDNACFESNECSSSDLLNTSDLNTHNNKISSRIQFVLLVMDWDQVEKNDVIGKIELNTQHHLQRLINSQLKKNSALEGGGRFNQAETSCLKTPQQNWFDIFNQPNVPILCTFQIKNY